MFNFNKGHLFLVLGLLVPAILLLVACGPSAPPAPNRPEDPQPFPSLSQTEPPRNLLWQ